MSKKIIAIEFGESSLKIAEGKQKKNVLSVSKLQQIPTPTGTIRDEKLQGSEAAQVLTECLNSEFFYINKKFFQRDAVVVIGNANAITRQIILPSVPGTNLLPMIRYEIESYLPGPSDEYVIKYNILEEMVDEEGYKRLRIFVGAIPKKTMEDFYSLAKSLKVNPIALEIKCSAIQRLYSLCQKINGIELSRLKTVALIDMGFSNISVHILRNGDLEQSGVIRFGGKQIRDAVSAAFDYEDYEAEEKIKTSGSLTPKEATERFFVSDEEKHIGALNDIIRDSMSDCTDELGKILSYYSSRNIGYDIEHVFIYGYMIRLNGITSYLSEALSIPVTCMTNADKIPLDNIQLDKRQLDKKPKASHAHPLDMSQFMNVIGALIQK